MQVKSDVQGATIVNPVLEYRRDIDGLRALAVIPVVLFHSGLGVFPGGYVGVDVFFVISGYLISSIILREIQRDQFSLSTFYCRRIKRIFPALFFMLFASVLVASVFCTAKDFNELGKSLYAVLLFYSNFYFFDKQGYFDIDAEEQLFLHTWSLSVEEQFYIIFPAFLLLLFRVNARIIKAVLLSLFVLSLTFSALVTWTEPSKAFYFSPLRFWELLCGVSLGVLNLLPIPVLDGGHLAYYVVEAVKGSPVSEKIQMAGFKVGLFLVVGLMVLALYNDLMRL